MEGESTMKKLLFASLLTVAVVFGATITLDDTSPEKKVRTKSTKSGNSTVQRNTAIKSGSGGHVGGGSGAGKVAGTESSRKLGGSHGDDTPTESNKTKTPARKIVRKKTDTTSTSKLQDKDRRK
jgi:hypothetical protein